MDPTITGGISLGNTDRTEKSEKGFYKFKINVPCSVNLSKIKDKYTGLEGVDEFTWNRLQSPDLKTINPLELSAMSAKY